MRGANPVPGTVAYGVTWDEAVEYCELVGGRLPKFDEYVFVATNRGTTEFPWGDAPQKGPWVFGPAGVDPSDQVLGVKGLFSNYGEWLWDINLGGPSSLLMQDQPAKSLKWHDERLVAGLPFGAGRNVGLDVRRLDFGPQTDSPRTFEYLFGDLPNRRMGFRVVYPMPTTKKK